MAIQTGSLTEMVKPLVEARLAQRAMSWEAETGEQEEMAKFVNANDAT